jgi:hypothetical protein
VNKAYVYTYGTDNTIDANRDIAMKAYDMEGFSNNPIFPTVQSVEYIPFDNTFNITASYFSTESNITKVYDCLALTSNADITKGSISNLIASNGTLPYTDGLDFPVYSVNSRSNLATGAYNALGESVQIVAEDFDKYQFVAVAEDGVGEMGVGYQVGGGSSDNIRSTMSITNNAGTITRDIEVTLDAVTDYKPDKSPWVLVLNYMHKATDTTATDIRTFEDGPPILPVNDPLLELDFKNVNILDVPKNGSELDSGSWGHTGNELFNVICNALSGGEADYAVNGLELRFLAKSSGHTRVIHFKTIGSSYNGFIENSRGNVITGRSSLTAGTHYTLYDGTYRTNNAESGLLDGQIHSAYLPGQTNAILSIQNNEYAMANHTFYKANTYHWAMTPTRWEVDDMSQNSTNAYHQVWVRANNIPNVFKGGLSVQSASILRTILYTVTFDPTGIAFTGSVIADENNTTNYYTLATTDPNLSRLQVVDLIENSPTSVASVGSNISANSNVVTDSILTQIVDVNNGVYSATAVNKAYVYTYAIDESGSNNHRDIDMKTVDGTAVYAVVLDSDKIFPDANLDPHTSIVNNYIVSDIFTLAGSGDASTSVGGFYIDLIPENIGDVYDFEYYWNIPYGNTVMMHGGFSLTSTGEPTATATPSRRTEDPGYHIDFYENIPTTPPNAVRYVTFDELGIGYTTQATYGGLGVTPPNGRLHKNRYFRATLVSGTTPPVDIQLELFEDEARTKLVWKINNWSAGSFYSALTATQVYFNFWIYRNAGYVAGLNNYFGNIIKNGVNVLSHVPYVKYDTIVQPTSPESGLTISDATVFSSVADIDNYYAFNLVTGAPAGTSPVPLDPDTLTDAQIVTFVQTYLQANITADGWNLIDGSLFGITTGTTVYSGGYTNNIMQYAVKEVPVLTFTHAFNTLTPSGTADISQITNVAEWRFSSYVIAVDTAMRYGLRAINPYPDGSAIGSAVESGFHLKQHYADKPSGMYWVQSATMPNPLQMFVDMRDVADGGGYDYYFVTSGPSTNYYNQTHAGTPLGLEIWMPRTKEHWRSCKYYRDQTPGASIGSAMPGVYSINSTYINPQGISYTTTGQAGVNLTSKIMRALHAGDQTNNNAGGYYRVKDGGRFWLKSAPFGEPNGDYNNGGWLSFYGSYNSDGTVTGFNDGGAAYTGNSYILSTNYKYSPADIISPANPVGW